MATLALDPEGPLPLLAVASTPTQDSHPQLSAPMGESQDAAGAKGVAVRRLRRPLQFSGLPASPFFSRAIFRTPSLKSDST